MTKCYIEFKNEVVEGAVGTKEEIKDFLKDLHKHYNYEGKQRIRNRTLHKWEDVIVYSYSEYYHGTAFVCYRVGDADE